MTTLARMDPITMRHLGHALLARAAAAEEADPARKVYRGLATEGVNRLTEILANGDRPTVGFFLRYRTEAP